MCLGFLVLYAQLSSVFHLSIYAEMKYQNLVKTHLSGSYFYFYFFSITLQEDIFSCNKISAI